MTFPINDKLREDVLSSIPQNYTKLQKAVYIYYQLCLRLRYSLPYYVEQRKKCSLVKARERHVAHLLDIDGEKVKDVTCFSFSAIFLQLLADAGVTDGLSEYAKELLTNKENFDIFHAFAAFEIDGQYFSADAVEGIFDKSDLTLAKYPGYKISGWCVGNRYDSDYAQKKAALDEAIALVQSDSNIFQSYVNEYLRAKQEEVSLESFDLNERTGLFLDAVSEIDDYSIQGFNLLLKLKHLYFTDEEQGLTDNRRKIELYFASDSETGELQAFLFYNEKEYVDCIGKENFNSLRFFSISLKNRSICELSRSEYLQLLDEQRLLNEFNKPITEDSVEMTSNGIMQFTPRDKDGRSTDNAPEKTAYYTYVDADGNTQTLTIEEVAARRREFSQYSIRNFVEVEDA